MDNNQKNVGQFSSQLSAKIWGHRFREGQRGPEYVLEFLNVMYGTQYKLDSHGYTRRKSENLRKFIFEGVKEGSKKDIAKLDDLSKEKLNQLYGVDSIERVEVIREFYRNLEVPLYDGKGKEADRSWYARTLYPLHESLLFFELRKKAGGLAYERNFFARGGELYYLMLSNGTKDNIYLKEEIEKRIQSLLTKNVSIDKITSKISEILGDEINKNDLYPLKPNEKDKEYPMLPVNEHPFFIQFAEELKQLLSLNVDVYEMFKLLTSLICFQLMRYQHDRAKLDDSKDVSYFFDCLDGQNNQIMRQSINSFKESELLIKDKFESYFINQYMDNIKSIEYVENNLSDWKSNPNLFLELQGLTKLTTRKKAVVKVLEGCNTYEDVTGKLLNKVKEVVSDQLKKHQLSIVRTLCKDGGIGNFKTGTSYRYTMSDTFLQTLVFINVKPKDTMEFSEFLQTIYEKYGFIVGDTEARANGLYEKSKLNIGYYQKNVLALRNKLKMNGLLVEYSDATAMIRNPYDVAEGVVVP